MKYIEEALKLESVDELEVEVETRRELGHKMVGQLYPSILADEIYQLRCKQYEIKYGKKYQQ